MDQNTEFLQAIMTGQIERVDRLLSLHPLWVQAHTENGLSLVMLACYYNQPAVAALLLERGAPLDLFSAAAVGLVEPLARFLDADHAAVNQFSPDGFQALGLACFFGHLAAARLLIERGAEVNQPSHNPMRVMPLHSAVAAQQLEISRLLLDHGADPNAVQADDFTPLLEAAQNGQLEMVELLLAHGADPTARKSDGKTALDLANEYGHHDVAALLSSKGIP